MITNWYFNLVFDSLECKYWVFFYIDSVFVELTNYLLSNWFYKLSFFQFNYSWTSLFVSWSWNDIYAYFISFVIIYLCTWLLG